MAVIPDNVKQQAYDASGPAQENIAQVQQSGDTESPSAVRGRMSPQVQEQLNAFDREAPEEAIDRTQELGQQHREEGQRDHEPGGR